MGKKRKTAKQYGLSPKPFAFCIEYVIDLNAKQAAIRAGYSQRTAAEQASRMLTKVNVQECVQDLITTRNDKAELTADMVLDEIRKCAFSNMLDYTTVQDDGYAYIDMTDVTRDQMAAVSECTVEEYPEGRGDDMRMVKKLKIKLVDKKGSLDQLMKHLGMYIDRSEVTHKTPQQVTFKPPEKK